MSFDLINADYSSLLPGKIAG